MRSLIAFLPLMVLGCGSDTSVNADRHLPPAVEPGIIKGRVCDPSGRTWLPDAQAYVNILGEDGTIRETRQAFSDMDGRWELTDLNGGQEYTVYVQYGADLIKDFPQDVFLESGATFAFDDPDCFDPLTLDVAVVTGAYDDFNQVLDAMGFANYELIDGLDPQIITSFLDSPEELSRFDIIFFNGGFSEDGVIYNTTNPTDTSDDTRMQNLRDFVNAGGSVYASDWAYDVVEIGWPSAINFLNADEIPNDAQRGDYSVVDAVISDASLSEFLGASDMEINYDLPVWPLIEKAEDYVSVHVRGDVTYSSGLDNVALTSSPLLMSFNAGSGKVVYSTFRVARNADENIVRTLQYMMYNL